MAPQILKLLFETSTRGDNFKLIVDSIASTAMAMAIVEPNPTAVTLGPDATPRLVAGPC
jgi:hypothetical protein